MAELEGTLQSRPDRGDEEPGQIAHRDTAHDAGRDSGGGGLRKQARELTDDDILKVLARGEVAEAQ